MKLRNLRKINESIAQQYSKALEDEHTILEPTEANALEMEKVRAKAIKDECKEQDKIADEVAKATNATEVNEPKKVKDRKELSKLLAEAKEAGKKFKISRCTEEGYRYLFEAYDGLDDRPLSKARKPEEYGENVTEEVRKLINGGFDFDTKIKNSPIEVLNILSDGSEIIGKVKPEAVTYFADRWDEKLIKKAIKDFLKESLTEDDEAEIAELEVEEAPAEETESAVPTSFEEQMDYLAADEDEAIAAYEQVIPLVAEENVKEQLNKILEEEKAHKAFLDAVKGNHSLVYGEAAEETAEEPAEEEVVELTAEEVLGENLNESKEPLKEETNMEKIMRVLNSHSVSDEEELGEATRTEENEDILEESNEGPYHVQYEDEDGDVVDGDEHDTLEAAKEEAIDGYHTKYVGFVIYNPSGEIVFSDVDLVECNEKPLKESMSDLEKIQNALSKLTGGETETVETEETKVEETPADEDELPFEPATSEVEPDDEFDWPM